LGSTERQSYQKPTQAVKRANIFAAKPVRLRERPRAGSLERESNQVAVRSAVRLIGRKSSTPFRPAEGVWEVNLAPPGRPKPRAERACPAAGFRTGIAPESGPP